VSGSGSSGSGTGSHLSVGDNAALASTDISSTSTGSDDSSVLARNEYIIMGLLCGVLVLLLAIGITLLRQRKTDKTGYRGIGVEKGAEDRVPLYGSH